MSIGRQDYTERKEARADRLEERAAKAAQAATDAFRRSSAITDVIPFGQPILVDHYSAKGHRRDLERSRQLMDKSVEQSQKADHLQARADAARSNTAISGDDPEAVQKIKAKLEALTKAQEDAKALNAYYRKHKTVKGFPGITDEEAARADAELVEQDASPYSSGKHSPIPAWVFSNRNGEINRLKKRLAQLEAVDKMDHVEIQFPGGTLLTNEEINRVQILFDDKPDEETRRNLKSYGFRWSPREGAWQAQRTPHTLRRAKQLLNIQDEQPQQMAGKLETQDAPAFPPQEATDDPQAGQVSHEIPAPHFPDENEYTQATLA